MITSSTYLPTYLFLNIFKMHLKIIKKPCYFSKYLGSIWFNRSDHHSTWPWSKALYLTGMDSLEVRGRTRQTRKAYREPVSNVNQELSLWRWPLEADKLGPNAQSSLLASYRFERVTWKARRTTQSIPSLSQATPRRLLSETWERSTTDDQPGFFVERNLRFDFEKGCNAHQRPEALLKTLK